MRFYRFPDLKPAGVPWTRKHLFYMEKDGRFPKRIPLGPNTIVWSAAEVDAFVESRMKARDSSDQAA
jgi:prophage regulatory protein